MKIGFIGAGNMASAILRGIGDMEKGCFDIKSASCSQCGGEDGREGL